MRTVSSNPRLNNPEWERSLGLVLFYMGKGEDTDESRQNF